MADIETAKASAVESTVLSWADLDCRVSTATQGKLHILKSVSGYAVGGRLLAVMGASGSGKTTLLDVLCNRKPLGTFSSEQNKGEILINGHRRGASQMFSYVPQQDNLLNTATVRETFETAALLRIADITPDQLRARVDTVLADMGLNHREHAFVGGGELRSLSGGERRRVSIGQEIVSSQNTILMLDEPTTGLDSTTAESVMGCLRDLARKKGMVIVATIHQPNSNITALFDDFMLMGRGECLYLGPFSDAVERFTASGFACPLYCNPTDFFISIAADEKNLPVLVSRNIEWLAGQTALLGSSAQAGRIANSKRNHVPGEKSGGLSFINSCPTSVWTQFTILVTRDAKQWYRDPGMLINELSQYIFLALFLGGMYYNLDNDLDKGAYGRVASLFFILAILMFTPPTTAVATFAGERHLFEKEKKDKMYTPFAWLLAKTAVLAPVEAFLCLIFSVIMYYMVGYQDRADKFFIFFVILTIFQLVGESVGVFFSAATSSPTFAMIWMSLFLIILLSLSGFLTAEMPIFYEWIQDSNVLRFGMLALILNEFEGLEFTDGDGNKVHGLDAVPDTVRPDPDLSIGEYIAILVGFFIALRILILVALMWDDIVRSFAVFKSGEQYDDHKGQTIAVPQDDPDFGTIEAEATQNMSTVVVSEESSIEMN